MTSAIDSTKPTALAPLTADVRSNFAIAASEITALQAGTVPGLAASTGSGLVGFIQTGTGAVARTLQSKNRDVISLKDFGAVGDGIADDTAALAAWLAACAGKAGYAPSGTYLTTAEMAYNVATSGSIMLFGDGPNTIFKASGASNKVLHISGTPNVTGSPVSLRSFSIQSGTSGTCAAGLHLDGIAHWFVQDVWIDGKSKTTNGFQCTGAQQGQVSGGEIFNCTTGALLETSGGVNSNGIDWHGMTFLNSGTNFKTTGADDVFFHANHLTSASMQIDLTGGVGMQVISDNHIEPTGSNNGMIVRTARTMIKGNSFYGAGGTTDINVSATAVETKIVGNLINANVTITAGATDTVFIFNSTGGTITDGGTRTRNFGNRAFAGTPLVGSQLYDHLTVNSQQAAGAAMLTLQAPGIAGDWGMVINGAGAAQDIYYRFGAGPIISGRTDNTAILNFKSAPSGSTWGTITSTGLNTFPIGATTPSTGAFTTIASGGVITSTQSINVLSAGTTAVGVSTNSSVYFLRDDTNGGTAEVFVDNTSGTVNIVSQVGSTVFVTGAPTAGQIQLTISGSTLQAQGGSSRNNVTLKFFQMKHS